MGTPVAFFCLITTKITLVKTHIRFILLGNKPSGCLFINLQPVN